MHYSVAILNRTDYSDSIHESIRVMLDHIGGMKSFVQPGQSVLLKPNLLTDRTPEQAVTTHPAFARAVIRLVKAAGGAVSIGDSPHNATNLQTVWEKTGYADLCREEDVPLINLDKSGSEQFSIDGISFSIAKPVLDADLVINLPKAKTHIFTTLTGAIKNMYGTVPGFQKTALHRDYPTKSLFCKLLIAIYEKHPPGLNIVDAVTGMQGDGPSGGEPRRFGFIAASASGIALDLIICDRLGIKAAAVPYLPALLKKHDISIKNIKRLGDSATTTPIPAIKLPRTMWTHLIPRPLVRLLSPFMWIRPSFTASCISCGKCIRACPAEALTIEQKGDKPTLDGKKCIECCCCHEVCPEQAISMHQSPFLNTVKRGRFP